MAIRNPLVKDYTQGAGAFGTISAQLNKLAQILGNIRGVHGVKVFQRGHEILIDGGVRTAVVSVFVGWRLWESKDWDKSATDSKATDYLKIPYDAVTAPSYISKATFEAIDFTAPPAADDVRNNALLIKISDHNGPCLIARTT